MILRLTRRLRRTRRPKHSQRGIALVEFAIIMPLALLVLAGIVEIGMMMHRQKLLSTAVRDAARYGVVAVFPRHSDEEIRARVRESLHDHGMHATGTKIEVEGASGEAGQMLTVRVQYPAQFRLLKILAPSGEAIAGLTTLESQIVMELE